MDIRNYFEEIKNDIQNAQTSKNLRILNKRAKKAVSESAKSDYNPKLKKYALREYKIIKRMIKARERMVQN